MTSERQKRVYILAGPNGAGKTTFAREYLTHEANCPTFINADLIAEGLSPFAPDLAALRAGRMMVELMTDAVGRGQSFAFETTLAGRTYARAIPDWRSRGYEGGHSVPEAVIRRRFHSGKRHFEHIYKQLVDAWIIYDCAGSEPVIIDLGINP